MIRRPPRSTLSSSSAASDVYKRQEEFPFHALIATAPIVALGGNGACCLWGSAAKSVLVHFGKYNFKVSNVYSVICMSSFCDMTAYWLRRGALAASSRALPFCPKIRSTSQGAALTQLHH